MYRRFGEEIYLANKEKNEGLKCCFINCGTKM